MRNLLTVLFMALAVLIGVCAGASAQERFALVIGNSEYKRAGTLPNPIRDAEAVTALLTRAGFKVTAALDLGQAPFQGAFSAG